MKWATNKQKSPEAKEDAAGKDPGGYGLKVMIVPPPPD